MTVKPVIPSSLMLSRRTFVPVAAAAAIALRADDAYPSVELSNGELKLSVYLPDRDKGFYRATRFDWSGVVSSLEYKGHRFYGPWFDERDPSVRDFIHRDGKIVAGPASGITGPVNEFQRPLGFDTAKPGETFIKVGVGALRKPDEMPYSAYRAYDWVEPGTWTVKTNKDSIDFRHQLASASPSGNYAYDYRKTLRLVPGKPVLEMSHQLTNTGQSPIATVVYNHNFLVLDRNAPGPDLRITFPFAVTSDRPPDAAFAAIDGPRAVYKKQLESQERVAFPVQGFGPTAKDHGFEIANTKLGVGMRLTGDVPLARVQLWSIRSVVAVEPFIDINIAPGASFTWKNEYTFFQTGK